MTELAELTELAEMGRNAREPGRRLLTFPSSLK